jgi:hypothetical protein
MTLLIDDSDVKCGIGEDVAEAVVFCHGSSRFGDLKNLIRYKKPVLRSGDF